MKLRCFHHFHHKTVKATMAFITIPNTTTSPRGEAPHLGTIDAARIAAPSIHQELPAPLTSHYLHAAAWRGTATLVESVLMYRFTAAYRESDQFQATQAETGCSSPALSEGQRGSVMAFAQSVLVCRHQAKSELQEETRKLRKQAEGEDENSP